MQKSISKIFSFVFHPLLIPTLGIMLIFNTETYLSYLPFSAQKAIYIIVLITTLILPLSILPFFLYHDKIKSVFLDKKNERILPMIITAIFFFFSFYILNNLNAPRIIRLFIFGSAVSVSISLIITYFWKISTHMIGIGGLLALAFILSFKLMVNIQIVIMLLILISGVIGTARMVLKAHNSIQIYTGFLLGFGTIWSIFNIL